MTASGWYTVVSTGTRQGAFNYDFADASGNPLGDPHGSVAALAVVVPNRISSGRSVPNVEVLMRGVQIDVYNANGSYEATAYSSNPAWVILNILRRCGWETTDLDLTTFAAAAAFCGENIWTTDLNGNALQVPRYECNLILTKRQSAAVVVRGIRVAARPHASLRGNGPSSTRSGNDLGGPAVAASRWREQHRDSQQRLAGL